MRSSRVRHDGPASSLLAYAAGRLFLAVAGWRVEGELPPGSKGVLIAAPHTSGWDLPYMMAVTWVFRLRLNWLGKHTLFEGPGGRLMRWLGGIPVDRRSPHGLVAQVVSRIDDEDGIFLAIAPAGTRSKAKHWKSGFYHIADGAQVPIICSFLDYRRKVGGVGPAIVPSGDLRADMDRIREFYRDKAGRVSGDTTVVALREELEGLGHVDSSREPVEAVQRPVRAMA